MTRLNKKKALNKVEALPRPWADKEVKALLRRYYAKRGHKVSSIMHRAAVWIVGFADRGPCYGGPCYVTQYAVNKLIEKENHV